MLTNNKVVGKVANIKGRHKVGIIKGLALAKLWEGRNQGALKNMSGTTRPGNAHVITMSWSGLFSLEVKSSTRKSMGEYSA